METHNNIKITVLPPRLNEEKVYTQPKEKYADYILGDFLDENQMDGFSIFEEGADYDEGSYNED